MTTTLLIASKQCSECLLSKTRIVTSQQASQLIRDCTREQNHFFCHKGTIAGLRIHCAGMRDKIGPSKAEMIAGCVGVPTVFVDPDRIDVKALSPCVGVCRLVDGVCVGCDRTIEQIEDAYDQSAVVP